ncbi:universal stress protein [Thermodesulfobacteriota bacterium]
MEIKKLLFVTKFQQMGFDALNSMLDLRNAALDHVVFLCVIERERVAMHRGVGYQKGEEIKLKETANIRFIDWAENLFEQGMEAGVYIVVGSLVSEVIKAVKKEDADLIVIGSSNKGVLEQLYSGSDVTEVLLRAAIPVLVFKHGSETPKAIEKPFERPLLATDWSPASLKAVEYLKGLKNVAKEISIIHVASEKDLKASSSMEVQEIRKQTRKKLEDIVDIFETEGINARSHVYVGDPVQEIERAARECQATMIVLGSSGKGSLAERWIGSIPKRIAEKSNYHTLLIPPDQK